MTHKILNEPAWTSPFLKNKDIKEALTDALQQVSHAHYDADNNTLNYLKFADSDEYKHLVRIVHALSFFDPSQLDSRIDQLSFWLNTYNTLVLHIVVSEQLTDSPLDANGFFSDFQYRVGDYYYSLDDIEHGILRANRRKYMSFTTPLSSHDPKCTLSILRLDPRVHFAFACSAKSSPPLCAFDREQVNEQLDKITSDFLGKHIELDRKNRKLNVPKLFKWYKKDFGQDEDIINFIAKHLADPEAQDFLFNNRQKMSFAYLDFNWQLNITP